MIDSRKAYLEAKQDRKEAIDILSHPGDLTKIELDALMRRIYELNRQIKDYELKYVFDLTLV